VLCILFPWMAWMGTTRSSGFSNGTYIWTWVLHLTALFFWNVCNSLRAFQQSRSKVSYYNRLSEYKIGQDIYKKVYKVMAVTGICSQHCWCTSSHRFIAANSIPTASVKLTGTTSYSLIKLGIIDYSCMSVDTWFHSRGTTQWQPFSYFAI